MKICRECGATEHVRRGVCRGCRHRALGPAAEITGPAPERRRPNGATLEPPHARPWVHKGSGTG